MTSEITDKEILNFFGLEKHEYEWTSKSTEERGHIRCSCGWEGYSSDYCAEPERSKHHNPSITLEWMLEALRYKKTVKRLELHNHGNNAYVVIEAWGMFKNGSDYVDCNAENETLALRGAVIKLIESEKDNG